MVRMTGSCGMSKVKFERVCVSEVFSQLRHVNFPTVIFFGIEIKRVVNFTGS